VKSYCLSALMLSLGHVSSNALILILDITLMKIKTLWL